MSSSLTATTRKLAATVWPRTSALTNSSKLSRVQELITGHQTNRNAGFTLVELLVVIALIGVISLFALPNVSSYFKVSLNSAARELASVVRDSFNASAMTGRVYRIVYDLENRNYWVETATEANVLLDTEQSRERDRRRKMFSRIGSEKEEKPPFKLDPLVTRRKVTLPRGVTFADILTEQSPEPITSGIAYTHFFPHGFTEQTLIHLKDTSDHQITLSVTPVLGRTRLIERYVTKEEL